jgi:pimeloyl-ACP methyl ester carboxylesterase
VVLRVLALATAALAASVGSAPAQAPPLREACLTDEEQTRVLRFRAADGVRLVGVELGEGAAGVLLAHGFRSDLCEWIDESRRLAADGYHVLALTHRNHGSSGWPRRTAAVWRIDLDVAAGVGLLRARGAATVVAAGSSMGASAVLAGAALPGATVDGVVSLSSPQRFTIMDIRARVRRVRAPTVFVAGALDHPFNYAARALHAASGARAKRLVIVRRSSAHGSGLLIHPGVRRVFDGFVAARSGRAASVG